MDGTECSTFKAACDRLGLLASDEEHHQCLTEASIFKTAHALRVLFVTIIIHSQPTDPLELFLQHKHNLFEDCAHQLTLAPYRIAYPTDVQVEAFGLSKLASLVEQQGHTMEALGLPTPSAEANHLAVSALLAEERSYDCIELERFLASALATANPEQRSAWDHVCNNVTAGSGALFFLDGPGGTGKTFVEKLCLASVRQRQGIALAVASSGVASLLLPGGRTAHSRFKIPVSVGPESTCPVSSQSSLASLLRATELIIWDEAVMQHVDCFHAVDRMLRDVRDVPHWFGGITVLFAGEFRCDLDV